MISDNRMAVAQAPWRTRSRVQVRAVAAVLALLLLSTGVFAQDGEGVDEPTQSTVSVLLKTPESSPIKAGDAPADRKYQVIAKGLASWYGKAFQGRRTASGERFDMHAFTAAHKTLPFGTLVRVKNVRTGKEVVVRINDRGPYVNKRLIDLSQAASFALGLKNQGVARVVLMHEH